MLLEQLLNEEAHALEDLRLVVEHSRLMACVRHGELALGLERDVWHGPALGLSRARPIDMGMCLS